LCKFKTKAYRGIKDHMNKKHKNEKNEEEQKIKEKRK